MRSGIMAVWSDITPEALNDYTAWYEREHMFDRLVVPGIYRARHYQTVSGTPQYFTYFITDNAEVMASEAYLASANNPSAWTRRILPHFRNTNRTVFNVVRRVGRGSGVAALTLRFSRLVQADDLTVKRSYLQLAGILPELIQRDGVIGAQLWQADLDATLQPVTDRNLRSGADQTSDWALFVDGTATEPLQALLDGPLESTGLDISAALEPPTCALHRLLIEADADEPPAI